MGKQRIYRHGGAAEATIRDDFGSSGREFEYIRNPGEQFTLIFTDDEQRSICSIESLTLGEARWIKADLLRKAMRASESLHVVLLKYVQVFMVQTAHTAIANARAQIDRRLARWILMAHDRTGDKTLALTHEFLALMLGVRRPGVTEALQSLKRLKLIDTGRNKIVVLNRNGIEKAAGHSYGVPEKEYRRLIG